MIKVGHKYGHVQDNCVGGQYKFFCHFVFMDPLITYYILKKIYIYLKTESNLTKYYITHTSSGQHMFSKYTSLKLLDYQMLKFTLTSIYVLFSSSIWGAFVL